MVFHEVGNKVPDRRNPDPSDSLETIPDAVPVVLTKPAIEDQLAWHTLWPESHKLYGHGNELFSLCCNNEGSLVASSCKVDFYHGWHIIKPPILLLNKILFAPFYAIYSP